MGLLKTAAKVAVASSVHGRVQRRQHQRWAAQDGAVSHQAAADAFAPPPPVQHAPPAPAAPSPADELQRQVDLLRQLGELRDSGIIDAAEFEAKKAKILG